MTDQTRDIATVFSDAYSRSVPKLLGDLHQFLLDTLEKEFQGNPDDTLLVIGPGGQVLPYSCQYTPDGRFGKSNRDRMRRIIRNGRIILVDYIVDFSQGGLEKGEHTLSKMGFFDHLYFQVGFFDPGSIPDPALLGSKTITFLCNNMRKALPIPDETVTVIDATLSLHHVTITQKELERVYGDIYRVLKPGGLLHLGEGNVDMSYAEDKIIRIGTDIARFLNTSVVLSDKRDELFPLNALFEPGKHYSSFPVLDEVTSIGRHGAVTITPEGTCEIKAQHPKHVILTPEILGKLAHQLGAEGYEQILNFGDGIVIPLIDVDMPKDAEGQIKPVDIYYDAILQRATEGFKGKDDELLEQITGGIAFERGNARRGTVEYYMGEEKILKTLLQVGFKDVEVTHHEKEPFYNITAVKPEQ